MTLFPLASACKGAEKAFAGRYARMREAIAGQFQNHRLRRNDRFDLECALFLYWSVEIGLRNAQTWWLDRQLAERRFLALLRHDLEHPLAQEVAAGPGMGRLYRQRFRDVLRTIRNIHVSWDRAGRLQVPLTERTTRLFLAHTSEAYDYPEADVQRALHRFLVDQCRSVVLDILPSRTPPTSARLA